VLDARLPAQTSPESEVVSGDENAHLWRALARLPERCQKLLRIVAWEPRPDYSSVAEGLDMPIGSIGPTRRRCLDKLRVELGSVS
jgi:DNA-directed RNA polymerase specialized sigma24 family protein